MSHSRINERVNSEFDGLLPTAMALNETVPNSSTRMQDYSRFYRTKKLMPMLVSAAAQQRPQQQQQQQPAAGNTSRRTATLLLRQFCE